MISLEDRPMYKVVSPISHGLRMKDNTGFIPLQIQSSIIDRFKFSSSSSILYVIDLSNMDFDKYTIVDRYEKVYGTVELMCNIVQIHNTKTLVGIILISGGASKPSEENININLNRGIEIIQGLINTNYLQE